MSEQPHVELVIVDLAEDQEVSCRGVGPHVGIWWADDRRVAALMHSPEEAERGAGFLDSPLQHRREWRRVARVFSRRPNDDYFCVPRGRVLIRERDKCGVIYHGNATGSSTLQRLADAFLLKPWKALVDEHYLMGDAADSLFDDDASL